MASSAATRAHVIASHISPSLQREALELSPTAAASSPDDVVICYARRTAIGKAGKGSFKNCGHDKMLVPLFKDLLASTKVNSKEIGDIVIGNVLALGSITATEVRIASLVAGVPQEVPCSTVNRQCSSGLQALANVAANIKAGFYDVAIAGGVENMSLNSMTNTGNLAPMEEALAHDSARGCYMNMGQTSEEVAARFGVTREEQDAFAVRSHAKAAAAQKAGGFREILPVEVEVEDANGNTKKVIVAKDEGVRAETTMESLSKLKAVFKKGGSTTAGNASQTSDGAALVLAARRSYAESRGLPIIGCFRSYAVVGVEPAIMGMGPAYAIPAALQRIGLTVADVDVFEINEAFASQALESCKRLAIPEAKVNPQGGAIAFGHPLGCTGARMVGTLLHEMQPGQTGIVSMCIGSGMGMAAVITRE